MAAEFATDLARWGPDRPFAVPSPREAEEYCRQLATSHYENFSVVTLFVPRRLHKHFHSIYAFCRWADDLADETIGGDAALALLDWWRSELLACYAGTARHPVFVALSATIREYSIPPEPFLDLISAFEQDQRVKEYPTFAELCDYCRRSANPVGRLVQHLGRCATDDRVILSDHICTGLQLANFWQDVARDLTLGRVYLPVEDRRRHGYSDDDLHARRFNDQFRDLMRFEVDRTRQMFHAGLPLIERMPGELRAQIELFARGGLAILKKIERQGYDVWSARPRLTKWDKAVLFFRVFGLGWGTGT